MLFVEKRTCFSIENILVATVSGTASAAMLSDALARAILSYALGFAHRYHARMSMTSMASVARLRQIIRERKIDFLIAETHACEKADLDKVVWELLRSVPCRTLIIGPTVSPVELAKEELTRIVYVTDFTPGSLEGLRSTLALAQDYGAQVKFIHVAQEVPMRPLYFGSSRIVAFRKRLERLSGSGEVLLPESEFIVGEGDRADGVVGIAARLHASLIVMTARGSPAQLLWPVAGPVVCHAQCPVLVVPGPPQ